MPKISIPKQRFEEMDIYTQKYNVRYRIITENQNNLSTWSPIFEVDPEFLFQGGTIEVPGRIFLDKFGSSESEYVAVTWDSASIYKGITGSLKYLSKLNSYDIWVMWAMNGGANPSDWIYKERASTTSVNINIPTTYIDSTGDIQTGPKQMYVEIYRPGRPILRYEQTYEFPQNATTVNITNDTINFGRGHGSGTGTAGLYLSSSPIGGLTNNTTYYTRTIDYTTIALYATKANALSDTSRLNLTSTGSGTGSFTGFPFRLYDGAITTL